jgi:prepilin-type N-terminal cleavage/methylation domain-containing protein/prepilin-type processing-associated H-X9-DG protein
MQPNRKCRRGFSLVELLVVIAVIGVLIALLLPSLTKARQAALRANCLSNIRQVYMGFEQYGYDFKGYYPVKCWSSGQSVVTVSTWIYAMCGGYPLSDGVYRWPNGVWPQYVRQEVAFCPVNSYYSSDITANLGQRSINWGYGMFEEESADNSFQVWSGIPWNAASNSGASSTEYLNTRRIPVHMGSLIMMADSFSGVYAGSWQSGYYGHMYGNVYWGSRKGDPGYTGTNGNVGKDDNEGCVQTAHGNYANCVFFDGHADSLTALEMRASPNDVQATYDKNWQLNWLN